MVKLQVAPGEIVSLPLDTYLVGVVAAEMPAAFQQEALKAQAVAARTYTLLRLGGKSDGKHPGAHLCAAPGHCQAWISQADMRKNWGLLAFGSYYEKVAGAVRATSGEVLVYQDQLIDPVYHASCGGRGTEDAGEVWGTEIPYLKSVSCKWDPPQRQEPVTIALDLQEFYQRLGIAESAVPASTGAGGPVRVLERTVSGRVRKAQVGSKVYRGVDLRKELGLRSTDFTVKTSGSEITFLARGYGHAVGMCQYGAQGLAQNGSTYRSILNYYYQGAKVTRWQN